MLKAFIQKLRLGKALTSKLQFCTQNQSKFEKCYYEILEIPRNASFQEIAQAYKIKFTELQHFEQNNEKTQQKLKQLLEAYKVLHKNNTRQQYDYSKGYIDYDDPQKQPNYKKNLSNEAMQKANEKLDKFKTRIGLGILFTGILFISVDIYRRKAFKQKYEKIKEKKILENQNFFVSDPNDTQEEKLRKQQLKKKLKRAGIDIDAEELQEKQLMLQKQNQEFGENQSNLTKF